MSVQRGKLRDHEAVVLEEFNGLWDRGGEEAVPRDHFDDCNNIQYIESGFKTRDGLDIFIPGVTNVARLYNYKLQDGESLIILDTNGDIYHALLDGTETVYGPILSIPAMDDFGFVAWAGRGYITPFENYLDVDGVTRQRGIQSEFLYVYKGDGTMARKAAGAPPTGSAIGVATSASAGNTELGFHLFAIVFETDTGYLTAPGPENFTGFTVVDGTKKLDISGVLTGPSYVAKRHIIATKRIINYNGDQDGFQFFFVPDGTIDNNTGTTISVEFFDLDLLDDASHLIDNFTEIPAGVVLSTYNSRLVLAAEFDNESLVRVSFPGEPEAIDQVDGLIIVPLDGKPITNAKEYRDILYIFKDTRTWASVDNGDEPVTWAGPTIIDRGLGASVHSIGEVLDSGGVNVEALLIANFTGVYIFSGAYQDPELSWKIQDRWLSLPQDQHNRIQIMNDTVKQVFFFTLPNRKMLIADYARGKNPKDIRWSPWSFDINVISIALVQVDTLIIGA